MKKRWIWLAMCAIPGPERQRQEDPCGLLLSQSSQNQWASGLVRDPSQKTMWRTTEEETWHGPLTSPWAHIQQDSGVWKELRSLLQGLETSWNALKELPNNPDWGGAGKVCHLVADDCGTARPVGLQDFTLKNQLPKVWTSGQQKQTGHLLPSPPGKTRAEWPPRWNSSMRQTSFPTREDVWKRSPVAV